MADAIIQDELKEAKSPAFTFDTDLLSYVDYKTMMKSKFSEMYGYVQKTITNWNFKTPFGEDAMKRLPVAEGALVYRTVIEALNEDIEQLEKEIKVNFDLQHWTGMEIEKIADLDDNGKHEKVAEMMLGIVRFPKKQPTVDGLTAAQGQAAYNAIMHKWQNVMLGKN